MVELVVNELLMLVFRRIQSRPNDSIKYVLLDLYSSDPIPDAKLTLYNSYLRQLV